MGMVDWVAQWEAAHPGMQFEVPSTPALASDRWAGAPPLAHGPGVNVMYTDGHVRFHDIGGLTFYSHNPQKYEVWYKLSLKQ